ncbi:MAG: DUF2971 domain-containing protein [Sanguibacteroides justesenii]|jgi:hypothetical protein|nr:DUF2971 domain-containing protein [Sanguibacteroides justesenii]
MQSVLFKYLDIQGAKAMLNNSNIQFTNAMKLNDPFDCHPGLIDFSRVTPERAKRYGWDTDIAIEFESSTFEENRERAWICCLSKVFDSILMWSYYNQHKGVCIGLDIEKVKKCILHCMPGLIVSPDCEVMYRDIINKPDYFADSQDFFYYQMCTKAKAWEHEQEVRMFIMDPSPIFMKLPYKPKNKDEIDWKEVRCYPLLDGACFSAIYLGVNISKEDRGKVIECGRKLNSDIQVYQMVVNPDAFKLDFINIS